MILARKISRIFLVLAYSAFGAFLTCFLWLPPRRLSVRLISRMTRFWGRGVARILGMRVTLNGVPEMQSPGVFVVSNHLGYLDIIAHSTVFPIRFTPKSDLVWWPLVGWLIAVSRPIWMKRQSRHSAADVTAKFIDTLRNGVALIVYPEGTSSDGANGVLPFKSSVFEAPARGGFPVLPIATSYPGMKTDEVCWYGGMSFVPHFWNVLGMKRIDVRIDVLPPVHPGGRDRRALALEIHGMIDKKFREARSIVKQAM